VLISIVPHLIGFLQGVTMPYFYEVYGFTTSPEYAALNVRYVRRGVIAAIGLTLYLWFVFGVYRKSLINVLSLFLFVELISAGVESMFGDFSINSIFSVFTLAHIVIALTCFGIFKAARAIGYNKQSSGDPLRGPAS
jgi:hypothetical protein